MAAKSTIKNIDLHDPGHILFNFHFPDPFTFCWSLSLSTTDGLQTFGDLGLVDVLVEACERVGWKKPSRIQEEAIPVALQVSGTPHPRFQHLKFQKNDSYFNGHNLRVKPGWFLEYLTSLVL